MKCKELETKDFEKSDFSNLDNLNCVDSDFSDEILNEISSIPQIQRNEYFNGNVFCKTEYDSGVSNIRQNRNCKNSTSFEVINFWYGVVTDVNDNGFVTEILDVETNNDELLNFDFDDVKEDDYSLVEEGATFQLYLGYHYTEYGQKLRSTMLIFDRYTEVPSLEESYAEIQNYRALAEQYQSIDR